MPSPELAPAGLTSLAAFLITVACNGLTIQILSEQAPSPITSWQIDGETVETVADFILGGSKITADGDCSHEIKRSACSLEENL